MTLGFLTAALVLALSAILLRARFWTFRAQVPGDYAQMSPAFDLRQHLNGPMTCEGVIYGPTGRVTSRFAADMVGHWDGNRGTLAESFHYDSGAIQQREWRLAIGNDGAIRAEADDVVGVGEGRMDGAAVQLKYRIRLPEDAGGHELDAIDWMYLVDDKTIINRSQFRKFGILVAELVATMRHKEIE